MQCVYDTICTIPCDPRSHVLRYPKSDSVPGWGQPTSSPPSSQSGMPSHCCTEQIERLPSRQRTVSSARHLFTLGLDVIPSSSSFGLVDDSNGSPVSWYGSVTVSWTRSIGRMVNREDVVCLDDKESKHEERNKKSYEWQKVEPLYWPLSLKL